RLPTERRWQCWQTSKKSNKNKHVIALTLGRLPTLSLRGQLPHPWGVSPSVLLARLDAQFFLRAVQRPLGDAFLLRLFDYVVAVHRACFQALEQELARLPLSGLTFRRLHGFVRRDRDVL